MNIESPAYKVIEAKPDYEVRQYGTYIIAETDQRGSRKEAQSGGFRELFRYISGGNSAGSKVTMTAPVLQSTASGGRKIPMSAPVIKQADSASGRMAFVMPPGLSLEELPKPTSALIRLRVIAPQTVAVIRFSGYATEGRIREHTEKLLSALKRDGRRVHSTPRTGLYNPPWTPPFMRRNEVMVEIEGFNAVEKG